MQEQKRAYQVTRLALPVVMAVLVAMLCLMMGARTAYAGGANDITTFKGKTTVVFLQKNQMLAYSDMKSGKKLTSAKSSNKKVATIKAMKADGGYTYLLLTMKKAGTTKITYKLAGKKKTVTLKVVKWKKPVKSFKIGSTNYASKYKKSSFFQTKTDIGGQTVKVKAARGWKVKKISYYAGGDSLKKIKNGKKLPSGTTYVCVDLKNKKTNAVETVALDYYPGDSSPEE